MPGPRQLVPHRKDLLKAVYWDLAWTTGMCTLALFVIVSSQGWTLSNRLFPLVVSSFLLAMSLWQLAMQIRAVVSKAETRRIEVLDLGEQEERVEGFRAVFSLAVSFYLAILVMGLLIAPLIVVPAYIIARDPSKWLVALLSGAVIFAVEVLVFEMPIHTAWFQPLVPQLQQWLLRVL